MIIGGSKKKVLKHIHELADKGELNAKAELTDPVFTPEQSEAAINRFYRLRKRRVWFWLKKRFSYLVINVVSMQVNPRTEVYGLENKIKIGKKSRGKTGAIVTCNHFNPLDNLSVRKAMKKAYGKNVYIVSQETNLALPGFLGFLLNHVNILPITKQPFYLTTMFMPKLRRLLKKGELVLIYPEEEMWFNYRKPRPCKHGAYQFAAKCHVPVIPCFIELQDLEKMDNDEFSEVQHKVHIMPAIYPDSSKTVRENRVLMAEKDYKMKCAKYEEVYGKKLDYKFSADDIAGWRGGKI